MVLESVRSRGWLPKRQFFASIVAKPNTSNRTSGPAMVLPALAPNVTDIMAVAAPDHQITLVLIEGGQKYHGTNLKAHGGGT